jgi:hypothetical protein
LATLVLVTVHAGKARWAGAEPSVERGAAQAGPPVGNPPEPGGIETTELPLTGSPSTAKASPGQQTPTERRIASQLAVVNAKLETVQREKRELEQQLRGMKEEIAQSADTEAAPERDEFDLDREDWKKLAAEGRIKYRIPCIVQPELGYTTSPAQLDHLGLSPDDGKILDEAHRRSNARIWATVRPLCLKSVKDASVVDLLGAMGCVRIIQQVATASDRMAIADAQRQVAEVHAGLRPAPEAGKSPSPLFDVDMALTSEGQLFEADLAESVGPEDAKRLAQSLSCSATSR